MWYPLFGNDVIPCPSKVSSSSWSDIRYLKTFTVTESKIISILEYTTFNDLWLIRMFIYKYPYNVHIYIHIFIYCKYLTWQNVIQIFLLSLMVNFAAILNMKEYYHISYSSFESSSHNLNNRKEKDGFVMSHLDFNL